MIRRMCEIDVRCLALFRIALGLVLFFDLLSRFPDLRAFYTDFGILPRSVVLSWLSDWQWSVHLGGGGMSYTVFIFGLQIVAALLFVVGWRTRLMTFICWAGIMSMHHRNLLILHGGDCLIRLMFFWSMFVPLGKVLSVDAGWKKISCEKIFSFGTAALKLQIVAMYVFTYLYKTGDAWTDGSAVWLSVGNPELATGFGLWLSGYPVICKWLTWVTLAIEGFAPLALLVTWWPVRIAAVCSVIALHLGIFFTMYMGIFVWVPIVSMFLFLPSRVFGNSISCTMPAVWQLRLRPVAVQGYCAICLIFSMWYNVHAYLGGSFSGALLDFRNANGLGQRWKMFAPDPPRQSQPFYAVGKLPGGYDINLLWDQREWGNSWRWRKVWSNIRASRYSWARKYYSRYLVRLWDSRGGASLQSVEMYLLRRDLVGDRPVRRWAVYQENLASRK